MMLKISKLSFLIILSFLTFNCCSDNDCTKWVEINPESFDGNGQITTATYKEVPCDY